LRQNDQAGGDRDRRLSAEEIEENKLTLARRLARIDPAEAGEGPGGDRHGSARCEGASSRLESSSGIGLAERREGRPEGEGRVLPAAFVRWLD
jgi:hypothetical protein